MKTQLSVIDVRSNLKLRGSRTNPVMEAIILLFRFYPQFVHLSNGSNSDSEERDTYSSFLLINYWCAN